MNEVVAALGDFFVYMVIALFAQNAVFTRALGVSRLTKIVQDEGDRFTFGVLLCSILLLSAPLAYLVNEWLKGYYYRIYLRPIVFLLCSAAAFFIILALIVLLRRPQTVRRVVEALPMATFNTCVLGTMLVSATQSFSFGQTMGFALGSGLGYLLALEVVAEGQRKLAHEKIPEVFRGLPATLLYIGILALAIHGFVGHTVTF